MDLVLQMIGRTQVRAIQRGQKIKVGLDGGTLHLAMARRGQTGNGMDGMEYGSPLRAVMRMACARLAGDGWGL